LVDPGVATGVAPPTATQDADPPSSDTHPARHGAPAAWDWEGNVQAAVVRHLAAEGWRITRVADTAARERGADIEADRDGERLVVEVKGYPSTVCQSGAKLGQPKPTAPSVHARHWFAGAVLSGLLHLGDAADRTVVLAFPDAATYRELARRTLTPRMTTGGRGLTIWFVDHSGAVNAEHPLPDDEERHDG
jgi:hypothetical protein